MRPISLGLILFAVTLIPPTHGLIPPAHGRVPPAHGRVPPAHGQGIAFPQRQGIPPARGQETVPTREQQITPEITPARAERAGEDPSTDNRERTWYKGNTHSHTELSGHADSSPEHVAKWYLDRGYNFLILSEHNRFINPDSVALPANRRDDFILIPGEEVTGKKVIHTTAMNIKGLVDWSADHPRKHQIIQSHVDSTAKAGGTPILNHPNFGWAVAAEDMRPVKRLHLFELYNGHPHVHNFGDSAHVSTEELWDDLLTDGMLIYGVSSDDAHEFKRWGTEISNPGRGWVMVRAADLEPDAITSAMRGGHFYATSGVILQHVDRGRRYSVSIDEEATRREMGSPYLTGHHIHDGEPGFEIQFIGPGGEILASTTTQNAEFEVTNNLPYVRAKVIFRRLRSGGGLEAFYAWTQPFFTDDRAELAEQYQRGQ